MFEGFDKLVAAVKRLPQKVDAGVVRTVDEAVTDEFKRQRSAIPVDDGDLLKSLTRTRDKNHHVDSVAGNIGIYTKLDYAKYQELPEPDDRAVIASMASYLEDLLERG